MKKLLAITLSLLMVVGMFAGCGAKDTAPVPAGVSVFNLLDYSICGYSLTAFLMYWCCFHYSTHGMLNRLKTSMEK